VFVYAAKTVFFNRVVGLSVGPDVGEIGSVTRQAALSDARRTGGEAADNASGDSAGR